MSDVDGAEELIKRASKLVERVGNLRQVKHYDQQFGNQGQQEFSVNEYESACVEMEEVLTQAAEKIGEFIQQEAYFELEIEKLKEACKRAENSKIRKMCKKIEDLEIHLEKFKITATEVTK